MKNVFIVFFFLCLGSSVFSQIVIKKDQISMQNSMVSRVFKIDGNAFYTDSYKNLNANSEYGQKGSDEFAFSVDGIEVSSGIGSNCFSFGKAFLDSSVAGSKVLKVELTGLPGTAAKGISVALVYTMYNNLPVIRKHLEITNRTCSDVAITDLSVEKLMLIPVHLYCTEVYSNYGTSIQRIPYTGNYNDPTILVFNSDIKQGIILGNEAPGILKETDVYSKENLVSIGMTRIDNHYPFKKWVNSGETFTTPSSFISFVSNVKNIEEAFEGHLADFVRTKMGVRIMEKKKLPFLFYNTWRPFRENFDEKQLMKQADALEDTGTDVFTVDMGWYKSIGDYNCDSVRFPQGMKYIFDYIQKKGMKPGLWISYAWVNSKSKLVSEHPDWLIKNKEGKRDNIHDGDTINNFTMSLGSPWYDYIKGKISTMVIEYNLAYVKLDLSIVTSPYVLDFERSGDYAFEGKSYKDHQSSYYGLYERLLKLNDDLHAQFPELLIDCTFETWGKYNTIDYSLIQHADYDWITNFEDNVPIGPISIRQICRERSKIVPAMTMLIGNQLMLNDSLNEYNYLSVASSRPVLLGDVTKMPDSLKKWYKKMNEWFKIMDSKYQWPQFHYAAGVFDMPNMGNWDGVYKFNKEKDGGVFFFYRNGSPDNSRTFLCPVVKANQNYRLFSPISRKDWVFLKAAT